MESLILTLLAETFIHVGSGKSEGAIDLPVNREATTNYPYIPGSGVKGALRDKALEKWPNTYDDGKEKSQTEVNEFFGKAPEGQETGNAGALLIGDVRLLLLPVRSLNSTYRWLTCPALLERFKRDMHRANGQTLNIPTLNLAKSEALVQGNDSVYMEEFVFSKKANSDADFKAIFKALETCFSPDPLYEHSRNTLKTRLTIISDEDFDWYARYGLPVNARNILNENKTSENLWYEETLAPDTLMYLVMGERVLGSLAKANDWLMEDTYLLMGGNETVGQGWFSYHIFGGIIQQEDETKTSNQGQQAEPEAMEKAS